MRLKVLLIEDNPGSAERVRQLLLGVKWPSFVVDHAVELSEGLSRLQKEEMDAVLLDMSLPDAGGLEAYQKIQAQAPGLAVVLLTEAAREEEEALQMIQMGAQDYLVKGQFDGELLGRALRYAIERKRVEKTLRASEELFRAFMDNSPAVAFMKDEQGRYIYFNKPFGRRFNIQAAMGLGKTDLDFWPEETARQIREHDLAVLDSNQMTQIVETVPDAEGSLRHWLVFKFPIPDPSGQRFLGGVAIDLSEQKRLEQIKDEFITAVSHELRTPLSITKEGIHLMLEGILGAMSEEQRKVLTIAKENIDRLARLINSLLDISKLEAGKVELNQRQMDLSGVIREVAAQFEPKIKGKGLKLRIQLPAGGLPVYADCDKVVQILFNLMDNAVKFTEKGGIQISAKEKEGFVECVVADTGRGISAEDLPKVFDKFQQFERTPGPGEKGTGLGLVIAKKLVDLHGGSIRLESELFHGSRFVFTLLRYQVETEFQERLKGVMGHAAATGTKMSLLLVELSFPKPVPSPAKLEELLVRLEGVLREGLCRKGDAAVRIRGGVAVLLSHCDRDGVLRARDRLEGIFRKHLRLGLSLPDLEFRYGYSTAPDDGKGGPELIERARQMLGVEGPIKLDRIFRERLAS
ncbi:MAG: PAS domain-containing protein [Candidatus Omnitrophica bacterium]|nr:PAS domain-containing protein [Candidatus Omnitrophota bacterium]